MEKNTAYSINVGFGTSNIFQFLYQGGVFYYDMIQAFDL